MRLLFKLVQLLTGASACLLVALYAVGRLATDRTHATQYLFWTPSVLYLLVIVLLSAVAWLAGQPARRRRKWGARAAAQRWTWAVPALASLLVLVHVSLAEWRAWRFVSPVPPPQPGKSLRVMHWNMTYAEPHRWNRYIAAVKRAPLPDVLIVSNPTHLNDLDELAAALGQEYRAVRSGIFGIFTRLTIIGHGALTLSIPPYRDNTAAPPGMDAPEGAPEAKTEFLPEWSPIPRTGGNVYDPGFAMFVRLDASATLGREIVIWGIDMPSEPRRWRMETARAARERLDSLMSADASPRFPGPDIILGDCNTPRGSASLELLSRGYPNAFDQAGRGYTASWPRDWSFFHIDHMFIGPGLRATSYRTMDLGISEHRAQIAEITTK